MNVRVTGDAEEIEWGGVRREGELPTRVSDRTAHPAKEVSGREAPEVPGAVRTVARLHLSAVPQLPYAPEQLSPMAAVSG